MAVLHRALLSWFLALVFLILLVIRLDQRTNWNWFIVFIPMWIFDGAVLTYSAFYIVSRCKSEPMALCGVFLARKIHFLITVILKMTTEILLCLKLEVTSWNFPLYYVFIPLWLILGVALFRIVKVLFELVRSRSITDMVGANFFSHIDHP